MPEGNKPYTVQWNVRANRPYKPGDLADFQESDITELRYYEAPEGAAAHGAGKDDILMMTPQGNIMVYTPGSKTLAFGARDARGKLPIKSGEDFAKLELQSAGVPMQKPDGGASTNYAEVDFLRNSPKGALGFASMAGSVLGGVAGEIAGGPYGGVAGSAAGTGLATAAANQFVSPEYQDANRLYTSHGNESQMLDPLQEGMQDAAVGGVGLAVSPVARYISQSVRGAVKATKPGGGLTDFAGHLKDKLKVDALNLGMRATVGHHQIPQEVSDFVTAHPNMPVDMSLFSDPAKQVGAAIDPAKMRQHKAEQYQVLLSELNKETPQAVKTFDDMLGITLSRLDSEKIDRKSAIEASRASLGKFKAPESYKKGFYNAGQARTAREEGAEEIQKLTAKHNREIEAQIQAYESATGTSYNRTKTLNRVTLGTPERLNRAFASTKGDAVPYKTVVENLLTDPKFRPTAAGLKKLGITDPQVITDLQAELLRDRFITVTGDKVVRDNRVITAAGKKYLNEGKLDAFPLARSAGKPAETKKELEERIKAIRAKQKTTIAETNQRINTDGEVTAEREVSAQAFPVALKHFQAEAANMKAMLARDVSVDPQTQAMASSHAATKLRNEMRGLAKRAGRVTEGGQSKERPVGVMGVVDMITQLDKAIAEVGTADSVNTKDLLEQAHLMRTGLKADLETAITSVRKADPTFDELSFRQHIDTIIAQTAREHHVTNNELLDGILRGRSEAIKQVAQDPEQATKLLNLIDDPVRRDQLRGTMVHTVLEDYFKQIRRIDPETHEFVLDNDKATKMFNNEGFQRFLKTTLPPGQYDNVMTLMKTAAHLESNVPTQFATSLAFRKLHFGVAIGAGALGWMSGGPAGAMKTTAAAGGLFYLGKKATTEILMNPQATRAYMALQKAAPGSAAQRNAANYLIWLVRGTDLTYREMSGNNHEMLVNSQGQIVKLDSLYGPAREEAIRQLMIRQSNGMHPLENIPSQQTPGGLPASGSNTTPPAR